MMSPKACDVAGCTRPTRRKTSAWCDKHYTRWKRHGDPTFALKPKLPFWDRVAVGGDDECWLWTGAVSGGGSPITVNNRIPYRVVYEERVGPLMPGFVIVPTCGQRLCCNPDHLRQVDADEWNGSWHSNKTECPSGHPYSAENTYQAPNGGGRCCMACRREAYRKFDKSPKGRVKKLARYANGIRRSQIEAKVAYWGGRCWICRGEWQEIDHVKPVSKGGANLLCNMRPICVRCNSRKRAQWPYPTQTGVAA
jgi:5-methylcytosine-specific restriction endonuclease McrA